MTAINQTATLAANHLQDARVTKRKAFNHLQDLLRLGDITPNAAAQLYAFFLPTPSRKPKSLFDWVWLAVGRKDVRYYLNYAYSDGEFLYGTDGHRMHRAPTDLAAGFYDAAGNQVEVDAKYPDISRVVTPAADDPVPVDVAAYPVEESGKHTGYRLPNGAFVQKSFLDDAVAFNGSPVVTLPAHAETSTRLDYNDGRLAVIMPIRA